jgi:S1-C subfamily serine protease
MKKRLTAWLIVLVLLVSIAPLASAQTEGLDRFKPIYTYTTGRFQDIQTVKWYAQYVQAAYELGLIAGRSDTSYEPESNVTLAEAVKLAAVIHATYFGNVISEAGYETDVWYRGYLDYALNYGLLGGEFSSYDEPATRAQIAVIFAKALPKEALAPINRVDDGAITDVAEDKSYADAVYTLYAAGVLTGGDAARAFYPDSLVTRAEIAAIVVRMVTPALRQRFDLRLELEPNRLYEMASPAVFFLEITDMKGTKIKTGSGFFINEDGLAVTNYHVIKGATSAVAITADGQRHRVLGVYATGNEDNIDLAIIQVEGEGFNYLKLADSDEVRIGETVYALGSPLGLKNTFSTGIISGLDRRVNGMDFIQTTAPISPGSSGGVLLNCAGKVVGVTTAYAASGQNINLIVPINHLNRLEMGALKDLKDILPDTVYYAEYYPVPDFGAIAKLTPFDYNGGSVFNYVVDGMEYSQLSAKLTEYVGLLEDNGFAYGGFNLMLGNIVSYYINQTYGIIVAIGTTEIDEKICVTVDIMQY